MTAGAAMEAITGRIVAYPFASIIANPYARGGVSRGKIGLFTCTSRRRHWGGVCACDCIRAGDWSRVWVGSRQ